MLGERSAAPISRGCGTGRRPGTLAKARAHPREAKWSFHTHPQMGAAQSGAHRNSRSVFVVGSRFYLASQATRLEAPNFRRDKETLAIATTGSGTDETAPGANSISRGTNRRFANAHKARSKRDRGAALLHPRDPSWAGYENPRR